VLNISGEVEMDAIVMDGKTLASGAVSAVRNIANPIQLARLVMEKVHRLDDGAMICFYNCARIHITMLPSKCMHFYLSILRQSTV